MPPSSFNQLPDWVRQLAPHLESHLDFTDMYGLTGPQNYTVPKQFGNMGGELSPFGTDRGNFSRMPFDPNTTTATTTDMSPWDQATAKTQMAKYFDPNMGMAVNSWAGQNDPRMYMGPMFLTSGAAGSESLNSLKAWEQKIMQESHADAITENAARNMGTYTEPEAMVRNKLNQYIGGGGMRKTDFPTIQEDLTQMWETLKNMFKLPAGRSPWK